MILCFLILYFLCSWDMISPVEMRLAASSLPRDRRSQPRLYAKNNSPVCGIKKKPARLANLMVPDIGKECQSRRCLYQLRKCTCQENRSILRPCASRTHQEHDILPALQRRLDLHKVIGTVHGLLVHLEDHIAAIQTEILGKRSLLHILHHHALAGGNAET